MPDLRIEPVRPVPDHGQPALIVEFTCVRCGNPCRKELSKPGFLPRYCDDCIPLARADRVKRWRERHPDQAKAAAKKQNDKRPRQGQQRVAKVKPDVNDASLTSDNKPADLTDEEWETLRRATGHIMESGGACYLLGVVKERSASGLVMAFPYRHLIDSLVQKNYLVGVNDRRFKNTVNPQGRAQALTNKARVALDLPVAVEPGNQAVFDYWMREALRQAAEKKTIRRDCRTKRGVEALVNLGLLQVVKHTETNTIYGITPLGRQVVPQLPTGDEEWAALGTDKYHTFTVVIPLTPESQMASQPTATQESEPELPVRQSTAAATWATLNDRQQAYLRAINKADQAAEEYEKWERAQGHWDRPAAAVWRWLLYATLTTGDTPLKADIRTAGYIDEGTGSTFAALEKRGLILTHYNDQGTTYAGQLGDNVKQWYVFVKITPAGRAAVRASDMQYKPARKLPAGTLKERQWKALEALYNAGDLGLEQDGSGNYGGFSWQWTILRLRDYKPQALGEERVAKHYSDGRVGYRFTITPFGRQYYEENRQRYAELYPAE